MGSVTVQWVQGGSVASGMKLWIVPYGMFNIDKNWELELLEWKFMEEYNWSVSSQVKENSWDEKRPQQTKRMGPRERRGVWVAYFFSKKWNFKNFNASNKDNHGRTNDVT